MIKVFKVIAERMGMKAPTTALGRILPKHEPAQLAGNATVATVQSYLRAAEGGSTKDLFALYRDLTAGGTHVQSEFSKRKLALLSQPMSFLPADRNSKEDVAAAAACQAMVDGCENWTDGLVHLLDSCLWPVSVVEKVYRPARAEEKGYRFMLGKLSPVNPTVLCFRRPVAMQGKTLGTWEEDLRFYRVNDLGRVDYSAETSYEADAARHVVHRGHLLIGVPDCWGGPMRSIVFWWLLAGLGRDWFARGMERWGAPFPVGKTDSRNPAAVSLLQEAFSLSTKIGGLVVDNATQVEMAEIASSGMADAYEKFLNVCNREISKAIVGQTLSAEAQATGLGSSVGDLHAAVREDIRQWDQVKLAETVRKQVCEPWLRMNGVKGRAPTPSWGGLDEGNAKLFAETLNVLKQSGWEPTDEATATVSDRMGFPVQRAAAPAPVVPGMGNNFTEGNEGNEEEEEREGSRGDAEARREEREVVALVSPRGRRRLALFGAQERMAEELGVPGSWLNPVREFLEELQGKAESGELSDEDLVKFMEKAARRVPELFRDMDVEGLAKVMEAGMGAAVMDEVRKGIRRGKVEG